MSSPRTTPPPSSNDRADRRAGRRIPPLVWIVLAMLVAWFVIARVQQRGVHVTPQGGTMSQASEGASTMPAAPAGPGAPATPAGPANGPNQPKGAAPQ